MSTETVFIVPRLNSASVAGGSCCPVPAEALIVPELEAVQGVQEAEANWQTAQVRVRHNEEVSAQRLAEVLADIDYPAESWNTAPPVEV
jgi:copper chaperone CopZ